jgi:hypothetical protein
MKRATNPIHIRIAWCRQQRKQACSEPEFDAWRAEEDGLRDALLNMDHADNYRLSHPELFERYVMGFEDGTALLRASRVEHTFHTTA